MDAGKTHGPLVPADIKEGDASGPALGPVHEVAGERIIADVRLAPEPDVEAIERMVEQRQIDAEQLQKRYKRQAGEKFHLVRVSMRAVSGKRVGNKMLDQKGPDRNDSAQRMEAAQQKRPALPGANGRNSAPNRRRGGTYGLLHAPC